MTSAPPDHKDWQPRTKAVRAGQIRGFQETAEAMVLTSGYAYDNAEQAAARFTGEDDGYVYSRFANPTVEMFETRLAAMDGARFARATASGMAAITAGLLGQLSAGDHLVASRALFGSCRYVADTLARQFGIDVSVIDGSELENWRAAVTDRTKVFFLESPSNPALEIFDIAGIAAIARDAGARLVVDNVFASPALQRPFEMGADMVCYSATKHIDGQGRVLGGAVLLNDEELLKDRLQPFLRNTGPALSPFNAWVLVKALETLDLRMSAMSATALDLAERLESEKSGALARVIYPFLASHPGAALAKTQMRAGGSVITLEFAGPPEEAKARAFRFLNALKIFDISNNLGDAKSLATHNPTTTHSRLTEEERLEQGVTPGMVRLSIGLEDEEDLWKDLAQALAVV